MPDNYEFHARARAATSPGVEDETVISAIEHELRQAYNAGWKAGAKIEFAKPIPLYVNGLSIGMATSLIQEGGYDMPPRIWVDLEGDALPAPEAMGYVKPRPGSIMMTSIAPEGVSFGLSHNAPLVENGVTSFRGLTLGDKALFMALCERAMEMLERSEHPEPQGPPFNLGA